MEPMEAAAPNNPCAKARSFCGNHSALLFVVPGHGPASPKPNIIRKKVSEKIPLEREASASAAPHTSTLQKKPFRHPILSYNLPETSWLMPYAIIKKIVIRPRMSFAFCDASGSLRSIRPRSMAIPSRLVTKVTPFFSFICTLATLTESRFPLAAVRIYWSPTNAAWLPLSLNASASGRRR